MDKHEQQLSLGDLLGIGPEEEPLPGAPESGSEPEMTPEPPPAAAEARRAEPPAGLELPAYLYPAVRICLNEGTESAREICERLIREHGAQDDRYLTGKPRIYARVCYFLDTLVERGELQLLGADRLEDRIYGKQGCA